MSSKKTKISTLSFVNVLQFATNYWLRQPKMFLLILFLLLIGAFLETYLPTALAKFLAAIQNHLSQADILYRLGIFLGTYLAQTLFFSIVYIIYNSFETTLFKSLVDDVFARVYLLPEKFFANTFTGSIVSKINRARQKIEVFEDQILMRIFPTAIILIGSLYFLMLQFPLLAISLLIYLIILVIIS